MTTEVANLDCEVFPIWEVDVLLPLEERWRGKGGKTTRIRRQVSRGRRVGEWAIALREARLRGRGPPAPQPTLKWENMPVAK